MFEKRRLFVCDCLQDDCIFEKAADDDWSLSDKILIEVEDLELSPPVLNCCKTMGIRFVQDIIRENEGHLHDNGFSHEAIGMLKKALSKLGLKMGMKLPE